MSYRDPGCTARPFAVASIHAARNASAINSARRRGESRVEGVTCSRTRPPDSAPPEGAGVSRFDRIGV